MREAILTFLLLVELVASFSAGPLMAPRRRPRTRPLTSSALHSAADDLDFMASLKSRVAEVSDRQTKLPLVVLDSMLPRQVLKVTVKNPVFMELVRTRVAQEEPYFGMTGLARLSTGQQVHLKSGVSVDIVGKPVVDEEGLKIELRGNQLFRIVGQVENAEGGWTEARVEFLDNEDDESKIDIKADRMGLARSMSKARKLPGLVTEWISLALKRERHPGQIDRLLQDLGEMPPTEEPSDRAMWVGALINPLPALGVALEIRPSLLTARTPEQRVDIALAGIEKSIQHMRGDIPLV